MDTVQLCFELPVGVLIAPVAVKQRMGTGVASHRSVKGVKNKLIVIGLAQCIRNDAFVMEIKDRTPAIAEGLEKLRSRVLIFCYQLSHIHSGKAHIQKSLAVWKPELERYTGLVQQIKEKSKERKALVAEKKELPIYHVKRHKALALRIAELTEDLEELRSEKALLLQKFEYAEDAGAEAFRKDIATMESGLKKLEAQEKKYSAELDKALDEYAELKAQAVELDPVELYAARQAIRPVQEKAAEQQLEDTTQEKPSLIMLLSAKQEASHLLGEDAEERQARQMVMQRQKEQRTVPQNQSKKKEHWER